MNATEYISYCNDLCAKYPAIDNVPAPFVRRILAGEPILAGEWSMVIPATAHAAFKAGQLATRQDEIALHREIAAKFNEFKAAYTA